MLSLSLSLSHTHILTHTQGAGESGLGADLKSSQTSIRARKMSVRDKGVSGDSLQPAASIGERERPP